MYMYICHIALKIEYSKYEFDIFYNIKKDLKINMPENHKSPFLSFIFFEKKILGSAGSLARLDTKGAHSSQRMMSYCSSELIHLNSTNIR